MPRVIPLGTFIENTFTRSSPVLTASLAGRNRGSVLTASQLGLARRSPPPLVLGIALLGMTVPTHELVLHALHSAATQHAVHPTGATRCSFSLVESQYLTCLQPGCSER
jgi:hypothetical protein